MIVLRTFRPERHGIHSGAGRLLTVSSPVSLRHVMGAGYVCCSSAAFRNRETVALEPAFWIFAELARGRINGEVLGRTKAVSSSQRTYTEHNVRI